MYIIKFLGCIFHVSVDEIINILNAASTCLGNVYHQVLGLCLSCVCWLKNTRHMHLSWRCTCTSRKKCAEMKTKHRPELVSAVYVQCKVSEGKYVR